MLKTDLKNLFLTLYTSVLVAIGILCIMHPFDNKPSNDLLNKYEQLVNTTTLNFSNSNTQVQNLDKSSQAIEKYFFKQPVFKSWFTNDTFYIKDLEIGRYQYHVFSSDEYFPEVKLDVMSVSNNHQIAFCKIDSCSNDIEYPQSYITFTYRNFRYIIAIFYNGVIGGGTIRKKHLNCLFSILHVTKFKWKIMNHTIYTDDWKIGENEYLKIFRDDNNQIFIEFFKK